MTVIAAGFDSGQLPYKKVEFFIRRGMARGGRAPGCAIGLPRFELPAYENSQTETSTVQDRRPVYSSPTTTAYTLPANVQPVNLDLDDELDVPDFLKS